MGLNQRVRDKTDQLLKIAMSDEIEAGIGCYLDTVDHNYPITRPTWVRTMLNFIVFMPFVTEKGMKRMGTWNKLYFFGALQLSVSW